MWYRAYTTKPIVILGNTIIYVNFTFSIVIVKYYNNDAFIILIKLQTIITDPSTTKNASDSYV